MTYKRRLARPLIRFEVIVLQAIKNDGGRDGSLGLGFSVLYC